MVSVPSVQVTAESGALSPRQYGRHRISQRCPTKFGWVILAYGISYVAPTLLYKSKFEGASFAVLSVWGYTASFVVGAPLMFTLPLFMFTRQLYHAKSGALEAFQERSNGAGQSLRGKVAEGLLERPL